MATMRDIAEIAGTSVSAVSHVLNHTRPVSPELGLKVMTAVRETGYLHKAARKRKSARGGRPRRVHAPVAFLGFSSSDYKPFSEYPHLIMTGCQQELRQANRSLIFEHVNPAQEHDLNARLRLLFDNSVDGAIANNYIPLSLIDAVHAAGVALVLADTNVRDERFDQVQIDNVAAGAMITDHLLALGHRRIATVCGDSGHTTTYERLAGVQIACWRQGICLSQESIIFAGDFAVDAGTKGVRELLRRGVEFTALVMQSDLLAMGALQVLHEIGIRTPQDVSVVGFDNIVASTHSVPPLTTVNVQAEQIGRLGVQLLLERLENPGRPTRKLVVSPTLIERDSTAPPPAEGRRTIPQEPSSLVPSLRDV